MPSITHWQAHDGAEAKAKRLGLIRLLDEVKSVVSDFELLVEERRDANGAGTLRQILDSRFESRQGWTKTVTGNVDWTKCYQVNGTAVCVGVEVQVSGRSDLVAVDLIHLKNNLTEGIIDVGVLIVPDDALSVFLTDRTPRYSEVERHLRMVKAEDIPLFVLAFLHDGAGPPLTKQTTRH